MRVSLLLVLLLLFSSCATVSRYEAKVRSWQGKSADELMGNWGKPDSIEKLSNGDRMFVYARLHREPVAYRQARRNLASVQPTGVKPVTMNRGPADTVYIKCATYFEVNPQNIIVSALFRGDECKSDD